MNRPHRISLLGAALAILVAGCTTQPAASTDVSPSAIASAVGSAGVTACPADGRMSAGRYSLTAEQTLTIPAEITVTDGWNGCGLIIKEFGAPGGPALIGFWVVENVYRNPCYWNGGLMDPSAGPSPDDLVTALVDQELTDADAPSTGTLGGHPASYVRLTVPDAADVSSCDKVGSGEPEFRFWKGPGEELTGSAVWWLGAADAHGLIGEVWAADVGGNRVVVQAAHFSDADQAEVDEIHAIVESITLLP